MKERVYQEFQYQFKQKFTNTEMIEEFFKKYVLDTVKDEEILNELNKKNRDIKNVQILDYLENNSILIRTIKICAILEASKDYKEFKKLNKRIKKDKEQAVDVAFEKLLTAIVKV